MEIILAFIIGSLYAAGLYMMLRRSIVKIIIGLALLAHAANLLIFTLGRLTRGQPAFAAADMDQPPLSAADPLPQALILTAIVIGFGVLAFAVVLIHRVHEAIGTDDMDQMHTAEVSARGYPDE